MQIVVAGGHGQIAMLLHPLLKARGHRVRTLIRNPDHVDEVRQVGAEPVLCDLEAEGNITEAVGPADAVVFAAGAGPGIWPQNGLVLQKRRFLWEGWASLSPTPTENAAVVDQRASIADSPRHV